MVPTFAKVNTSIVENDVNLSKKITRLILGTELTNKHREKKTIYTEICRIQSKLKSTLSDLTYLALMYKIGKLSEGKYQQIQTRQTKKLSKLRSSKTNDEFDENREFIKQTIHNFSSYELNDDEKIALSFGLDQHIPSKLNNNEVQTEFESLYQSILKSFPVLPNEDKDELKTKLRNICNKYVKTKIPKEKQTVVDALTKRDDIILLKQDKGKGIVILDKSTYTNKCLELLNSTQFKRLDKDPTRPTERKLQSMLRKIKPNLPDNMYRQLYPTGSSPGKFYGLAKVHKLNQGDGVEKLPLRPIISNIGTATYKTAKYLAQLLSPLNKSEFSVKNTKTFLDEMKNIQIGVDQHLISFDVTSLFTNVPLLHTIDIILRRIYDEKAIQTNIKKADMRDLLLMCTKNVHFNFDGKTYAQIDGVAMGSPLGPVIAGIFMVELETTLCPLLKNHIILWRRYVDDILCIIKQGSRDTILTIINGFHPQIQFTYEEQTNNMIAFLDILLINRFGNIDTTVYRKPTNTNVYMNWNSFAPEAWKKSTLKVLIQRAHMICNQPYLLECELDHLKTVFTKINNYPVGMVRRMMEDVSTKIIDKTPPQQAEQHVATKEPKEALIVLPYAGLKGEQIGKEIKTVIRKMFPEKMVAKVAYRSKKLGSRFNIKDKNPKKHENNLVYKFKCSECPSAYIGETARRLEERVIDHNKRDKNSHILKHSKELNHQPIGINDVKILSKNFRTNEKRKISEALFIRSLKPTINVQGTSTPLLLFN